ncbi:MAG: hypothetical protein COV91_03685 [Candidatus Taylorbacteria bacterium CG11_big_fil_rev_8_21_14_0_20_46_11]|uniref:Uncharacterized protein n=1 Tax=Candidatus Taylorbacteria bacterium CG11_big_fil_rev_8_21_14_0_20_46_11 TaxID=1975025 RepID=A0A2H0KBB8_9BACT|nr:MAG: hypothetical protein COV91_03685 [Candidatus Taylorbacteria bacterium CG11_big_fil_rev_8_21_14_0_20_46_11]
MTIAQLLNQIKGLLDALIPFIVGLTVLVILWGIFNYVVHGAEEEKRAEGKQFILYGIIGLFLMMSIWGLVNLLVGTFHLTNTIDPDKIPQAPKYVPESS